MPRADRRKSATRGGATVLTLVTTPGYREGGTVESTVVGRTVGQPRSEQEEMAETLAKGTAPRSRTAVRFLTET